MAALGVNNGSDNSAMGNGALANNTNGNNMYSGREVNRCNPITWKLLILSCRGAESLLFNSGNGNTGLRCNFIK